MRLSLYLLAGGPAALTLSTAASAAPPVVQPVPLGTETVRYEQGVPTVDLRLQHGAVQVRPLPLDHGSLAFAVAVFNGGDQPANIDTASFSGLAGTQTLAALTVGELAKKAKSRAMWSQIGLALAGGLSAAAAASQRDRYSGAFYTPHGVYRSVYSAPSALGQVQAMAITAGTAYGMAQIQNQLDHTLRALGNEVVQMSTIDPGGTYGGRIVLQKIRRMMLPQRVTLTVTWNGESYPFAFQVAKAGTPAPAFPAITPPDLVATPTTATTPVPAARDAGAPQPAPDAIPPATPDPADRREPLVPGPKMPGGPAAIPPAASAPVAGAAR